MMNNPVLAGLSNIEKQRIWRKTWWRATGEARATYRKEYKEKNPNRVRLWGNRSRVKKAYGLSLEAYELLRRLPCEICGKRKLRMHVDHDHKGPKQSFRGVLCQQCNTQLGWFENHRVNILNYLKTEEDE